MRTLNVGIVGGSITGCTAAILAARAEMHPTVFERSSDPLRDRGAGLGVPTATCIALRDQQLIAAGFPHIAVRALAHRSRSNLDPVMGVGPGLFPTFLEALRWGHLYEKLAALLPKETYQTGTEVSDALDDGDSVELILENGSRARFDLVIFADGYRSLGRSLVSPNSEPKYQGYFIWRGTVPESELHDVSPFEEALQRIGFPGGHMFAYLVPNKNGSSARGSRDINWGMFLPMDEDRLAQSLVDKSGAQQDLSIAPGWMRPELEAQLKASASRRLPDYFSSLVQRSQNTFGQGIVATYPDRYHAGRMCLAGDAGAVVPPFTTSGVFKGMKNAAELVAALQDSNDMELALNEWDMRQVAAGRSLKKLSDVMEDKLIRNVPDFGALSESDSIVWWAEIQAGLNHAMR